MSDGLAVVARALAEDATATAATLVQVATAESASRVAAARADAEALLEAARRDGENEARRAAAALVADARGAARQVTLGARRDLYQSVRDGALTLLRAEAPSDRARALAETLARVARDRLGDGAEVVGAKDGVGVVARAGEKVLTLDLAALVDAELARRGGQLGEVLA